MPSIESTERMLIVDTDDNNTAWKSPAKVQSLPKISISSSVSNKSIKIKNYKNLANSFNEENFVNGISFDAKVKLFILLLNKPGTK